MVPSCSTWPRCLGGPGPQQCQSPFLGQFSECLACQDLWPFTTCLATNGSGCFFSLCMHWFLSPSVMSVSFLHYSVSSCRSACCHVLCPVQPSFLPMSLLVALSPDSLVGCALIQLQVSWSAVVLGGRACFLSSPSSCP